MHVYIVCVIDTRSVSLWLSIGQTCLRTGFLYRDSAKNVNTRLSSYCPLLIQLAKCNHHRLQHVLTLYQSEITCMIYGQVFKSKNDKNHHGPKSWLNGKPTHGWTTTWLAHRHSPVNAWVHQEWCLVLADIYSCFLSPMINKSNNRPNSSKIIFMSRSPMVDHEYQQNQPWIYTIPYYWPFTS